MKKCLIIARNTFREAIRDRILYLIAVFAIVIIVMSKALGWVSVERDAEIIGDLSLFAISLLCLVLAIFVGTGLIYKELDKRTIYTILSKPVERWQFVIGKYLGLVLVISLMALGMEVFLILFLGLQGYLPSGEALRVFLYALILIHGEIFIITAVAITLSLITSPVLSAVLTLVVWLAGNSSQELVNLANTFALLAEDGDQKFLVFGEKVSRAVYVVTPHLNYFSEFKRYAFWPDPRALAEIDMLTVGGRMGYAVAYAGVMLCVSVLIFRRRSF